MIWGVLFGQYQKIEQNGLVPLSLDASGDKNANVKAGAIMSISGLCWYQYFIVKVKIRQSIRKEVTSKWLTRQNSLMSGYKGGTPSDLFVSITFIITLGVPLTSYFHCLSQIKIKIAICCWKILKPFPGECWRPTPIWTLTASTLSEGCASWSQKHYKHYKWSRHLTTRSLQMAPHHIWWLASKKCQPSAKWTLVMEALYQVGTCDWNTLLGRRCWWQSTMKT